MTISAGGTMKRLACAALLFAALFVTACGNSTVPSIGGTWNLTLQTSTKNTDFWQQSAFNWVIIENGETLTSTATFQPLGYSITLPGTMHFPNIEVASAKFPSAIANDSM